MSHTVLPTNNSVPIENVVVAESGDDSDDGWNYIEVHKDKELGASAASAASADIEQQQQQQQQQDHHHLDLEPDTDQKVEHHQFESSHQEFQQPETHHFASETEEADTKLQQQSQFVEDDIAVTSPTPTTASLDEIESIQHSEDFHAVAQAFAEPEEACSELLDAKKDENIITESGELALERVERSSSSAVAEHDSDLGADQDLEDMDSSSLNPEAAEFVPVSPQRTMSSPLGNGINPINRHDLFDDEIVSQSPRKGTVIDMDNIEVPSDHDFEDGASKCPSNLKLDENDDDDVINASPVTIDNPLANVQLNFETIAVDQESSNEMNNTPRPESSSSQCSYQEMNLKEAMHGDEKQELAAELLDTAYIGNGGVGGGGGNGCGLDTDQIDNYAQHPLCEDDPMKMSFYEDDGTKLGAFENNNPFKEAEVDMNSVQPLPDDAIFEDDNKENGIIGDQQQQQPQQQQHYEQTEQLVEHHYEQSLAAHDYENVEREELAKEAASESEKLTLKSDGPHDDNQQSQSNPDEMIQEQHSTITQVVQQMASEVTSVLSDFENEYQQSNNVGIPENVPHTMDDDKEPHYLHENNEIPSDVIIQSKWSVNTNEFKPVDLMSDFGFENQLQKMSLQNEAAEQQFIQSSNEHIEQPQFVQIEQQQEKQEQPHQQSQDFMEPTVKMEIPQSFQSVMAESESIVVEPVPIDCAPLEPNKEEKVDSDDVIAAAAAAATIGVAATAAIATAAAVKSAKSTAAAATTTKKPSLTGSTAGAKKPLLATSKVASKPTADIKPKTATGLSKVAAARAAAPRVTAAAPKSSSITSSTAAQSGVTRKPLNGVASTLKKATTSTVTKTSNGISRPTIAPSKPLTSRTVSSTTATKTATSSSVPKTAAAPRVPLSQRSVAPKPATAASKVSATKSAASSIGSRVKSAPPPSTTRSTQLTKPKTTTDKPLTSTRTSATSKLSPTKLVSSTTTTTIKKSPISKTTTTTTTTTTSSATAKKLTPIKRPTTATLTRTPPSKTAAAKVPTTNGVASKTKTVGATDCVTANGTGPQKLNGHAENGNVDNNAIIDLSTD